MHPRGVAEKSLLAAECVEKSRNRCGEFMKNWVFGHTPRVILALLLFFSLKIMRSV
jgi:hypothetical protein